jgi:hypothetical protein
MKIRAIALAVVSAIGGAVLALSATSGAATTATQARACLGSDSAATRYVVTTGVSLNTWMRRHHTSLGNVVQLTVNCEGGGLNPQQSRSLITDLNAENFTLPLARGTVLWTFAP